MTDRQRAQLVEQAEQSYRQHGEEETIAMMHFGGAKYVAIRRGRSDAYWIIGRADEVRWAIEPKQERPLLTDSTAIRARELEVD